MAVPTPGTTDADADRMGSGRAADRIAVRRRLRTVDGFLVRGRLVEHRIQLVQLATDGLIDGLAIDRGNRGFHVVPP
jgi:hypothetical protein